MRRLSVLLGIALLSTACGAGASTSAPPASVPGSASASEPATEVMASGQLVNVDGTASGTVQLVVMGETYEIVLEDFAIDSIEHTNVVLVPNAAVTMSDDIDPTKILDLGPLKATSGMQAYVIPAEMSGSVMTDYRSVIIWDTAMSHVIAAATLG